MTKPLLSIITITKNNLSGLQKTKDSITAQTCKDYEWIVIDGNSNDGTQAFLEITTAHYITEDDNGIYNAMNKGIERAKGQYLLFLNAGDALESKNTIFEIEQRLQNQNYDFIYGDSVEKNQDNLFFKRSRPHFKIIEGMFTHHQAMIYSHKILKDIKYNENYKIAADYDLTWRAIEKSTNFLYLPFPVCLFEEGGISQQQVLTGRIEQFKIRKAHNVSLLKNAFIFLTQTLAYFLRKTFPKFYWLLKKH